ncbi:MAG: DUF3299 domain-containing protein [Planctomycetes bacterium]|nr:DUF3299 domain-containing protein [Planctomycetota bacterium]
MQSARMQRTILSFVALAAACLWTASDSALGQAQEGAGTSPSDKASNAQQATSGKADSSATGDAQTKKSDDKYLPPANRFSRANGNKPLVETPKTPEQLAKEKKDREAARKRGEITFDDLKFEMEKGGEFKATMLTDENKALDKKIWKLRGFILPTTLFSNSNIKEFVLVRDNQECCFGPGAALYDCVMVTMAPGKSINFSPRIVTVKGKLEIDTESFQYPDDGGYYAVYKMTAEEVK